MSLFPSVSCVNSNVLCHFLFVKEQGALKPGNKRAIVSTIVQSTQWLRVAAAAAAGGRDMSVQGHKRGAMAGFLNWVTEAVSALVLGDESDGLHPRGAGGGVCCVGGVLGTRATRRGGGAAPRGVGCAHGLLAADVVRDCSPAGGRRRESHPRAVRWRGPPHSTHPAHTAHTPHAHEQQACAAHARRSADRASLRKEGDMSLAEIEHFCDRFEVCRGATCVPPHPMPAR